MKVTMMLADVTRVAEGKLDVLGGGFSFLRFTPAPFGVGLIIELPWADCGQPHTMQLVLTDEKSNVVMGDNGEPVCRIDAQFGSQRPPGVLLGPPQSIPMGFNFNGMPLENGKRYRFVLTIDNMSNPDWELAFSVADAQPSLQQAS